MRASAAKVIAGLHWENYADWERPEDPDHSPTSLEPEYGTRLFEALAERLRGAEEFGLRGGWSGLYPLTPDGEFIIGPYEPVPGFYNALGGGGVGVQTAAGVWASVNRIPWAASRSTFGVFTFVAP